MGAKGETLWPKCFVHSFGSVVGGATVGVAGPPLGGRGLVVGSTVTCVQTGSVGANAAWQAAEPSTQRKAAATEKSGTGSTPGQVKKKKPVKGGGWRTFGER